MFLGNVVLCNKPVVRTDINIEKVIIGILYYYLDMQSVLFIIQRHFYVRCSVASAQFYKNCYSVRSWCFGATFAFDHNRTNNWRDRYDNTATVIPSYLVMIIPMKDIMVQIVALTQFQSDHTSTLVSTIERAIDENTYDSWNITVSRLRDVLTQY